MSGYFGAQYMEVHNLCGKLYLRRNKLNVVKDSCMSCVLLIWIQVMYSYIFI